MATVLIVDDNVDICRVLARLVRAAGHDADHVLGGQEALDYLQACLLQAKLPDMMILDIMMPRVDGFDVLRAVRNDPRTAELPVIMFTAAGDGAFRERAMSQGANGFWVKGTLDIAQITQQLSTHLAPTV